MSESLMSKIRKAPKSGISGVPVSNSLERPKLNKSILILDAEKLGRFGNLGSKHFEHTGQRLKSERQQLGR